MGCVTQIGEQGWNVGRMAVLAAGWPVSVSATTVDRQCGSSMQTNFNAAAAVMAGQLDLVVSAGVEMMSRVPMGSNGGSISERVTERYDIVMQGTSAELLADEWHLSREDARRLLARIAPACARRLGRRQVRARDHRRSSCPTRRLPFAVDEAPRRETSAEALAALPPAFRPGRRRDRRELVADRRRLRRRADRERGRGRATRARAARAIRLVRASPVSIRRACCTATRRRWNGPLRGPG